MALLSPRFWPFLKAERAHICMQIRNKIWHFPLCPEAFIHFVCKSALVCVQMAMRSVWCAMPARYETWHRARERRRLGPIVMEASRHWSDGWWRGMESSQKKRSVGRDSGHTLLHLLITSPVWRSVPAIEAKTASVVRFLGMDWLKLRLSFVFRTPLGQLKLNV